MRTAPEQSFFLFSGPPPPKLSIVELLRSRLLRRTPLVYSPTSQPLSACNCRREYYSLRNLPEFLCFLCFLGVLFFLLLSFFLSRLRWHLSGLSELPLQQRLLLLLTGESFPFFHDVSEDQCFSNFCSKICCMIRACCRRAPTVFTTASTAQHSSAISPQSICASKQTELARASTCRRAFIPHAEFSKRTKKSKSARHICCLLYTSPSPRD